MTLSFAALAVAAFAVGLLLHWKKTGKKVVPWMMLVAGFGIAGMLGSVLNRIASSLTSGTTSATERLFGTGVPVLVAVLTIVYLAIHLKPKGQPPTRFTPWVALAFASILVAAGGAFAAAAATSETALGQATTGAWEFVVALFPGGS
jgi:drug/metabolite transporter (DMT)-like permease